MHVLQATLASDEAINYRFSSPLKRCSSSRSPGPRSHAERRILREIRGQLDQLVDAIAVLDQEEQTDWLDREIPPLGAYLLPDDNARLLDHARRLLICPHGILHHLPFHALDWEQAPLIQRFAVSYVPNITSLLLTRPASPTSNVLSVGIGSYPPPLENLPSAEQEARDITAIYQRAGTEATVLLGASATGLAWSCCGPAGT